jgi:hypothetical protein
MRMPRAPSCVNASHTRWVSAPSSIPAAASSHACHLADIGPGGERARPLIRAVWATPRSAPSLIANWNSQKHSESGWQDERHQRDEAMRLLSRQVPRQQDAEVRRHAADDRRRQHLPRAQPAGKWQHGGDVRYGERHQRRPSSAPRAGRARPSRRDPAPARNPPHRPGRDPALRCAAACGAYSRNSCSRARDRRGCMAVQVAQIVLVHRQDQVEAPEIRRADLARTQRANVDAPLARGALAARIRRTAGVIAGGRRRVDLETQLWRGVRRHVPQHPLRGRAAADVAKADEQDPVCVVVPCCHVRNYNRVGQD